jgi:hypothetical protein
MQRAVISIGIRKTGGLPELQAAHTSAQAFAEWAKKDQKIPASRVKLITDAKGRIGRERIYDEVEKITALGYVEQLIVYFSGHGINSGLYEQWLLSRAPEEPGAAINVRGSEMLARFCGIGHVVFISDACRTAAASIQAQSVTGGEIFPNSSAKGVENPVDQYYATLVGNPAYEVKTVEDAVGRYRAAYSTVLLEALRGKVPAVVDGSSGRRLVRPRRLRDHLKDAVPLYMHSLQLDGGEMQQPAARIESDETAWLADLGEVPTAPLAPEGGAPAARAVAAKRARVARPPSLAGTGMAGSARDVGDAVADLAALPPPAVLGAARRVPDLAQQARAQLQAELLPAAAAPSGARRTAVTARAGGGRVARSPDLLAGAVTRGSTPFGPDHFETQCGIKLRGARVVSAGSREAQVGVGRLADVVQVHIDPRCRGANVLVRLEDGSSVVVPAFRDFITGLTFDARGALDDMWCEPSANTARHLQWQAVAGEIGHLRALVAAASSLGVFRLDDDAHAMALLDRMRAVKMIDPAMAVYAAWALHDRRMRSHIAALQRFLDQDLGVRLFDVALLSFALSGKPQDGAPTELYPCVPMLSQGWALLPALGVALPERLAGLRGHLRPSLWTHFAPSAFARLEAELC